jgi:NADPH2:quinone reductase
MKAAWYERQGAARDVLHVGEMTEPEPGRGEVRVRVEAAGVNPADVKRRAGKGGRRMPFPRVVPGDDAAGVIDRIGPGVPPERIGQRAWVHSANHNRPFGTAAQYVVVPATQAIALPANVPFDVGACLGVPALTAHRCVFADGPVDGRTVLVTGGAGAVAHYAIELAHHAGATVVATVSTVEKRRAALRAGAQHVVDYRDPRAAEAVRDLVGKSGVDRIIDVAFGANLPLTSRVIALNGTLVSYGSDDVPEPVLPFYPLMRRGVTIRLVSVFHMPVDALRTATSRITRLVERGDLTHPVAARYPLERIEEAHSGMESGGVVGKILVIP